MKYMERNKIILKKKIGMTITTQEEKIEYIYKYIKSEKRNKIFKIFFKIFIIITIFYWTQYIIKNVGEDQIKSTISEQIWEITAPIIKDLVSDLETGNVSWIDKEKIQKILKENPSLLNNLK